MDEIVFEGIDGSNPLGFLTAIGALTLLSGRFNDDVKLSWRSASGYNPVFSLKYLPGNEFTEAVSLEGNRKKIAKLLADILGVPKTGIPKAQTKKTAGAYESAQKKKKDIVADEKQLRLRTRELILEGKGKGLQKDDLKAWVEEKVLNIRETIARGIADYEKARQLWLSELKKSVYSDELSLGKTLSITPVEYRCVANDVISSNISNNNRRLADFLSAFATESVVDGDKVKATPFCFVTGSGHQYFLETIGKLMEVVDAERIEQCLFFPWTYDDEQFSLRWAPIEDRRYALMWTDPGDTNRNPSKTIWAANLLAYNSIRLLPVADIRGRLGATGFSDFKGEDFFSWPIWQGFIGINSVRSLLSLATLRELSPDRKQLNKMGIIEVFRCQRLRIGTPPLVKFNFSTALPAGLGE